MSSMPLSKPQLLIFDFDGTIVDSAGDIAWVANKTFVELGLAAQSLERITSWIGAGAPKFIERAMRHFDRLDLEQQAFDIFMRHYPNAPIDCSYVYSGVSDFLEAAYQANIPMAISSNKPQALIPPILEHFKLDSYFDAVFGGDSFSEKKPNPISLLTLCEQFSVKPKDAWMIGDSDKDSGAAVNAGTQFVGVDYGYETDQSLLTPKEIPSVLTSNLNELSDKL